MPQSAPSGRARLLTTASVFLSGALVALAQQPQATNHADAVKKGHELYLQHCVSCHGSDGAGDGPAASALKVAPADLTAVARNYHGFPTEKIMDWIDGEKYAVGHGSREMPVWGKRFRRTGQPGMPGEVQQLATYLESIQKK